jgi:hypothetical protein
MGIVGDAAGVGVRVGLFAEFVVGVFAGAGLAGGFTGALFKLHVPVEESI